MVLLRGNGCRFVLKPAFMEVMARCAVLLRGSAQPDSAPLMIPEVLLKAKAHPDHSAAVIRSLYELTQVADVALWPYALQPRDRCVGTGRVRQLQAPLIAGARLPPR